MFIFNLKINKDSFIKVIISICIVVCISLMAVFIYNIYNSIQESNQDECLPRNEIAVITDENYSNILKMVHENLDNYIGQKVSYTGYVYRVSDIKKNEFILARNMVVSSSPKQTVVVGFLASYDDGELYENGAWVSVTGTIEKGYYLEEVPILKISEIKRTSEPKNSEVPMPDDYYIPTAVIY